MAQPSDEMIKTRWDDFAEAYQLYMEPSALTIAHVLMNAIGIGNLGEFQHEKVIEVCCGSGFAAQLFCNLRSDQNISLYAVDLIDKMILKFQERLKGFSNCFSQVANAQKLPFPDEFFTGYYSNLGLQIVSNEIEMIREAHRVLKPKGKAAFSIWGIPERSPLMTLLSTAIENLKLSPPKNLLRSNFHLGGNPFALKEKFLSNSFSHFVSWSQPMVLSPVTAEFAYDAIMKIPNTVEVISKYDLNSQNQIKDEMLRIAHSFISNSQPLSLDVEIIVVTKE